MKTNSFSRALDDHPQRPRNAVAGWRAFRRPRHRGSTALAIGLGYAVYFLTGLYLEWTVSYTTLWTWIALGIIGLAIAIGRTT